LPIKQTNNNENNLNTVENKYRGKRFEGRNKEQDFEMDLFINKDQNSIKG